MFVAISSGSGRGSAEQLLCLEGYWTMDAVCVPASHPLAQLFLCHWPGLYLSVLHLPAQALLVGGCHLVAAAVLIWLGSGAVLQHLNRVVAGSVGRPVLDSSS